jgi:hypothetical protein
MRDPVETDGSRPFHPEFRAPHPQRRVCLAGTFAALSGVDRRTVIDGSSIANDPR